jgi:mannose-6-phosphate isomerase
VQPIVFGPNMPDTFYRGAGRIERLRGGGPGRNATYPEDWVASTASLFGRATDGMTRLGDGMLLADVIAADPVAWLGQEHVARYGADPALLVKLLDAGQRLPLHVHPGRDFATRHLASPYGKTEAWIVLEAEPDAGVHLGFSRDVVSDELAGWVSRQDVESMLAVTNRIPVTSGTPYCARPGARTRSGPGS